MKKISNNIIITYFTITLILVLISQYFILKYSEPENLLSNISIASLTFVIYTTILFRYLIIRLNNHNKKNLKEIILKNEELFKSNERYDIVAKATSDTIWDWDLISGKFIFNKGISGVFGYKKENVEENIQWWFDKIHHQDSLKMSVKIHSYVEQKTQRWQEYYRFLCADGTYKYIYDRGFLVMDEKNNVVRVIGAMQDITKMKKEEERLKLFETVITQTKDSVIITETVEKENSIPNIIYANPAFTTMTGYKQKDIIHKKPTVFISRESIKYDIKKLADAFKKKEEFSFVGLNKTKEGNNYWINFTMIPIVNEDNKHSHWISIHRDVTKEKEKEKEREQLISELTKNNNDLKQFSYITSHNLRAPLSNLTGLLNLMEDITIDNEELKEIINGFSKSTGLLNETINDLVKIIFIKDNAAIEKELVSIKDVFENVFNQLSNVIGIKKPIIKLDFEKAEEIIINKSYLESILLNLLTNALKYSNEDKQLKISITSKAIGNNIVVLFKDNGIGIDMIKNKDKIFGLYQRFHDYPDSKGLGLYLVKSQVESMGGEISVESEIGIGTTFKITFNNNLSYVN